MPACPTAYVNVISSMVKTPQPTSVSLTRNTTVLWLVGATSHVAATSSYALSNVSITMVVSPLENEHDGLLHSPQ